MASLRRNRIVQSISITTLALATLAAGSAHAQEGADTAGGLDDIVVTARKVNESQQRVPVAVTVQTGAALVQQGAVSVPDIGRLTPGINFTGATSSAAASTIAIRGQVQTDILATLDPSVGTYVDGFYWARAYGLNANLLDIKNAQVLRGPQGTLFGRNTTGGALLIESNDPNYDGISGSLSGTYGRYNEVQGTAILNAPIVADKVAVRGAFTINSRDGFARNLTTGRRLGEQDSFSGRAKLRLDPTETLQITLSGEWFGAKFYDRPYQLLYVAPSSPANAEAALGGGGSGSTLINNYINSIRGTDNARLDSYEPRVDVNTQTYVLTINHDTDFGAVKFIGGYRHVRSYSPLDLDGSPFSVVDTVGQQNLKSYSGEVQVTGKAFDDVVDFAAGAFAFRETGRDESTSVALPRATLANPANTARIVSQTYYIGDIDNQSLGLYFQGTFHLTEKLSLIGGLRYSAEDKNIVAYNQTRNAFTGAFLACLIGTASPASNCAAASTNGYEGISYTAGVNYQLSNNVLVYAKTSKGFRSGGQNLRAAGSGNTAFAPFGNEIAREQEVGFKSELFDRRLRFNLAAFYNEVSNIQRTTLVVIPASTPGGSTGTATVVSNAGKARFYGGEAELTARVAEGLTVSANGALTDAKYLNFQDQSGDRRDEAFQSVPKWTFSIAGDYQRSLSSGTLHAHLDYAWRDKTPLYYYRTALTGNAAIDAANKAIREAMTTPAGGELNGRLGVGLMDDKLELAIFGRNILNRRVYQTGLIFPDPLFVAVGKMNDPVTYGVQATIRFGQ
ncbi:MAG: TonB-dependent receptor [Sphingobium sp.]